MVLMKRVWLAIMAAFVLSIGTADAQSGPASGLYKITSGTYIECCGIGGDFRSSLPNDSQGFVRLTVDSQTRVATMTFLGQDQQSVFSVVPCPLGGPISFSFNGGLVFSNYILFHVDPGPPPYQEFWNYTVSNSANSLRIDGLLGRRQGFCVDVPSRFIHSNVVAAALIPTATVRVSEMEVCWNSAQNTTYQVQYRTVLDTNGWVNLGSPVPGNGSTNCITDKVLLGQPRRFYRVVSLP